MEKKSEIKKKCTKCRRSKLLSSFHKHVRGVKGRASRCKLCVRGVSKLYYTKNSNTTRLRMSKYRNSNKELIRSQSRRYYDKNKDTIAAKTQEWQERNSGKVLAYKRKWAKNNPETRREQWNRYRSKKYGTRYALVDKYAWELICAMSDNCCTYCGTKTKLTQDHVLPLSKGGWHDIDNVVPACLACNIKKNDTLVEDLDPKFFKVRGLWQTLAEY